MALRFYLFLSLVSILVIGWVGMHYQFEGAKQAQLEDLVSYPIYAYLADTTKVSPLLADLRNYPELDSLQYETGASAGRELTETYSLPLNDQLLSGFSFPDIITIRFKADAAARFARHSVISTLRQYLEEEDLDQQSIAWNNSESKLKSLGLLSLITDILVGLLLLLTMIFGRQVYEQRLLLLQKRKAVSVVDYLRLKSLTTRHTFLMFFLPLVISFGLYYILVWQNVLQMILPYWFMGAVAGTLLVATLITMTMLHLMDHDNRFHDGEISVVHHEKEAPIETIIHHPKPLKDTVEEPAVEPSEEPTEGPHEP